MILVVCFKMQHYLFFFNYFRKQFKKVVFENYSLIFIDKKYIWKPKIFLTFLNIIIFIFNILFLIIML